MKDIIRILVERDGISEEEARALINETRDEIMMLDNPLEADVVLMEYLGLEPDYLEDVLGI
jgi:hypothetical protein